MDLLELGRRQHGRQTVVHVELIRDPELFEQPQDALGSGAIEPGRGMSGGVGLIGHVVHTNAV